MRNDEGFRNELGVWVWGSMFIIQSYISVEAAWRGLTFVSRKGGLRSRASKYEIRIKELEIVGV